MPLKIHTGEPYYRLDVEGLNEAANPKDVVGAKKAPLRLVPPALMIAVAPVMANGAEKYGAYNWREHPVRATSYTEAAMRHLLAWQDGENVAQDSGLSHLAHAAACLAILLDADGCLCMIDDRPSQGPAASMLLCQDRSDTGGGEVNVQST